jgi:hypothetical protein
MHPVENLGLLVREVGVEQRVIQHRSGNRKQNHIVDKFKKGKIDEEKLVNKLNSTNLFNPQKLQDAFDTAVSVLDTTKDLSDNDAVTKGLGKGAGILGFGRAEEEEKASKKVNKMLGIDNKEDPYDTYIFRINPKKAKAEIISLYEATADCLDDFNSRIEEFERKLGDMKKQIEGNNDKEDVKHLKAEVTYVKGLYKATMRISKKFLQQSNTLQGIMVAFTKSDGEVEEVQEA